MPDIEWNKSTWTQRYDWSRSGEEWSGPWGKSSAEWFSTIMPRIGAVLPASSVLEIGPGFGRWTEFLLRFCNSYCGVDLSDRCINECRRRFNERPNADFFHNDGKSLAQVSRPRFDLIFSFESLVHADLDAMSHYVPQIVRLLAPDGVAFLHHSNMAAFPGVSYGNRSENVSAEIIGGLVQENGGRLLVQERLSWGEVPLSDCFSMFCREDDYRGIKMHDITDHGLFALETKLARDRFQHYLELLDRAEFSTERSGK
jgi:SAM-dependent methyltransferase